MDYVAMGYIITNSLCFADGSRKDDLIGGSVLYAACGLRLWTDSCLIVASAGADFHDKYGEWFGRNGLSTEGIAIKTDHTVYQILKYRPDGVYDIDYPYGNEYGLVNFGSLRTLPEEVLQFSPGAKGVYVHMHPDNVFFGKIAEGRCKQGFRLMWEYLPSEAVADEKAFLKKFAGDLDLFSINYPESCELFGTDNEAELIEELKGLEIPLILFRVGERGLYTIAGGRHWFVPSVGSVGAVDPTGCGNCSTGAALYAYCEGYDPLMVGIMANVAASYNVLQYGPYPRFTEDTRREAMALAQQIYRKYGKN